MDFGEQRSTIGPSSFAKHEASASHAKALEAMRNHFSSEPADEGQLTGVSETVPRIDRFFMAGLVVARHDSFADYTEHMRSLRLVSHLPMGEQAGESSKLNPGPPPPRPPPPPPRHQHPESSLYGDPISHVGHLRRP